MCKAFALEGAPASALIMPEGNDGFAVRSEEGQFCLGAILSRAFRRDRGLSQQSAWRGGRF